MIYFENLNKSPMTASSPKWQEDIIKQVNQEYQDQAIEASEQMRQAFSARESEINPGYYATAFMAIMEKVPRYAYIKHIKDGYGSEYEAVIDLILHTVSFVEVEP